MDIPALPATSDWGEVFRLAHAVALLVVYWVWRFLRPETKATNNPAFLEKRDPAIPTKSPSTTKLKSLVSNKPEESADCIRIRENVPLSTAAERTRFMKAHGDVKTATDRLSTYIEWREKHRKIFDEIGGSDDIRNDADLWDRCATTAQLATGEKNEERIPRLARMYIEDDKVVCDKDGKRMLHVMPGQMDLSLAQGSTYATALALYIDHQLDRFSMDEMTVLLDVRGGEGWPNTMPHHQLPFIQNVTKLLLGMFPERCHRCIIYPVPLSALWIWNVIKVWLDRVTASKMVLLCGPATIKSPPPHSRMKEYMDEHVVDLLEAKRKESFVVAETS